MPHIYKLIYLQQYSFILTLMLSYMQSFTQTHFNSYIHHIQSHSWLTYCVFKSSAYIYWLTTPKYPVTRIFFSSFLFLRVRDTLTDWSMSAHTIIDLCIQFPPVHNYTQVSKNYDQWIIFKNTKISYFTHIHPPCCSMSSSDLNFFCVVFVCCCNFVVIMICYVMYIGV